MSRYDFSLKREAEIRGRVRDARTRQPVPGAVVRLGVEFGDPRNDRVPLFPVESVPVVETDDEGRFEVGRLDRRLLYILSVVAPGRGQALVAGVVPDGGHRTVLLPQGPFLYGRLRGRGGVPKDAVVSARRLEQTPNGRRFNVSDYDGVRSVRDRKGFYGLSGLLPGAYLVTVKAERFGAIETVVDMTEGLRSRLDLRLRARDGDEERDAELLRRLPPVIWDGEEERPVAETTLLRVDARRPADAPPFPAVRVSFWELNEEVAAPMEFNEPVFELVGLSEGSYRAILTHRSLSKPLVADRFTLERGERVEIVLR
jgi:hypothetical protein